MCVSESLFKAIDEDQDGFVSSSEFLELVSVLDVQLQEKNATIVSPRWGLQLTIYNIVQHPFFEFIVDLSVFVNAMRFVFISNWDQIASLDNFDYIFMVFFLIEQSMKIYGISWKVFWKSNINKFDFITVGLNTLRCITKVIIFNSYTISAYTNFLTNIHTHTHTYLI